jgi:DNA-binding transcriptional ArsR family regulator
VGISPGSASEQASVLREAGLIVSRRDGNRMIHQLTPLGMVILNSRG